MRLSYCAYLILLLACVFSCSERPELREEDVPPEVPTFELIHKDGHVFDGYIFLRSLNDPSTQFMINEEGKVVWFQQSDTTVQREVTPYEESYIALYNGREIHEITYDGDTLLKLKLDDGGVNLHLHHEIFIDSKDRVVALSGQSIPYDLTRFGGVKNDTLPVDGILVLSRLGEELWHWTFDKVVDTMRHVDAKLSLMKGDWAHANAVHEDVDGNYLISWRNWNQVWKINSTNGDVMWRYGIRDDSVRPGPFHAQHAIHVNRDGDYMVFDNGTWERRRSRAVAFNFVDGTMQNTLVINLPDSVFSQKAGSVYQYEKDRFLFSIPQTGDLIVTNRTGDVIWRAKGSVGFYRAYYLDESVLD